MDMLYRLPTRDWLRLDDTDPAAEPDQDPAEANQVDPGSGTR